MDKAVAAAHTFFLANPDHMEMKQNLDYYKMMAGVEPEDFRDLEAKPHMVRADASSGRSSEGGGPPPSSALWLRTFAELWR